MRIAGPGKSCVNSNGHSFCRLPPGNNPLQTGGGMPTATHTSKVIAETSGGGSSKIEKRKKKMEFMIGDRANWMK